MNQIELTQKPVIKHKLQEIGAKVTGRLSELNLENQVATSETIQTLKNLRAELNKELADFEGQRKAIKEGVNNPYLEFEAIYKVEISEKYKAGIDTLKDKIATFEDKIKTDKSNAVEAYFNELCISEKIDFIKFENLGLDINLTISEKKYKEQVNEFIAKVQDDLALIKTTDFEAEILTEYKDTLNVSQSIVKVKERKDAEAKEAQRIKAEATLKRQNACIQLGLKWSEITSAYEYSPDTYITKDDIQNLTNDEFIAKFASVEAVILEAKRLEQSQASSAPVAPPVAAPVQAPIVAQPEQKEPIKTASFEVTATWAKLRALGEYMTANGITYKNI